jgi:protein TonB
VLLRLQRPSPRLPGGTFRQRGHTWLVSAAAHAALAALVLSLDAGLPAPVPAVVRHPPATRLTWVTTRTANLQLPGRAQRGGGGGGDGRPLRASPARVAAETLPSRVVDRAVTPSAELPWVPPAVNLAVATVGSLDAVSELPPGAGGEGRGEGSGGGLGEGRGTGIGPGVGAGVGPGSGGGSGGGVYRPGGGVTAPVVVTQVRPTYPEDAVTERLQGSVSVEMIVRRNGVPDTVRVVRPAARGPLEREAERVVLQWRFLPGRLNGTPVDVLVTVIIDFVLY